MSPTTIFTIVKEQDVVANKFYLGWVMNGSLSPQFVEKTEDVFVLTKDELEDEFNKLIQFIGNNISFDNAVENKRLCRQYLNELIPTQKTNTN